MQYKLIGTKNDYLINPMQVILNNRGIENIEEFLNVNENHINHYSLLNNIDKAVQCLLTHLKNNNIIYLQVDSDVDGYSSASLLYNYIKRIYTESNLMFRVHIGKEHGVVPEEVPNDVSLVIIADAGSNQYNELKQLKDRGIECLVLDHHECDTESKNAIIVNNQMCEYPNKNFSGVGICYKFCQAIDEELGYYGLADEYLDLVALGNIADVIDMRSLETRYYTLKGLQNIKNPFLKALFEKQNFSTKGIINIINTAFYIAPLINACVRFGSNEDKENMFKAFIGSNETIPYKKRGATEEIQEPISQAMARICTNIKARQNTARDKSLVVIEDRISEKNLLSNKILIVDVTEILEHTLTGLVASQLANKYKRPILLLRYNEKDGTYGGSARGYEKGVIKDFKQLITDTNKFIYASGHSGAFGFSVTSENIVAVNESLNNELQDIVFEDIFDVDFIVPVNSLNKDFVLSIDKYSDLWSHGIEEPLIAFTGINISTNDIAIMGEKQNTIKIKYKDIDFIKFFCTEEEVISVKEGNTIELDIVGKCKSNSYNGSTTAQVVISDFNIKKSRKFVF